MTWRVGEVTDGRYEVTGVHEHGGMGVVYRVRHLVWDIDLAVKSPRPDLFRSAEDQRRFVAEAETWVSLGLHPYVCNCFYVRVLDGVPRVFAEYVPGGSLHEWIDDRRLYDGGPTEALARILDIAVQTAWGLDHAHGHGLVHRDVKPANVLLDPEDGTVTAKITDFGLARARAVASTLSPDAPPGASILVPGGEGMTPRYASPEQAAGEPVGRRTDIYSFAVSVLEMCAGEVTWMTGPAAGAALAGYRAADAAGAVAVPEALADLLERCLRPDPADRPNSMADVAAELIDIYRSVTGEAYPRPPAGAADLLADELNNRAVSLLDLDRRAEADEAFAAALAADPQHVRAIYNAGMARWRRGAITDEALIAEIEATRMDIGDSWEVRYALAQIHLERGDLGAARDLLDALARERPDEPEVITALRMIRSGEIIDARCVREWQVPWPLRPPSDDPWQQVIEQEQEERVALALTPDGRFLAAGGWDGRVRVWDAHGGQDVWTLKGHRRPPHAIDLTPDGRFAVSVCEDESVGFWELTKGAPRGRLLYASPKPPSWDGADGLGELALRVEHTAIRLTPDGRFALYAGLDGALRFWDVHSGRMTVLDEAAAGRLVAVSADGRRALSVGWRGRKGEERLTRLFDLTGGRGVEGERVVRVWDLADGRCRLELTGHESTVTALCLGADGRFAAIGSHDGTIRVWDLDDGRRVHVLTGKTTSHPLQGAPDTLSLGSDARFLLSGSRHSGVVQLWELDRGRCLRTFRAHRGGTTVVRLDARDALSAGQDKTVRRWRLPGEYHGAPMLSRPRRHVELSRLGGQVDALIGEAERATAAGRFPAALDLLRQARAIEGYERAPRVMSAWRGLGRRAVRADLRAAWSSRAWHVGGTGAVDLSGDGRIAVSGGDDGTVRLWDVESGDCLRVLQGHERAVQSVCLSADGRRLLSASKEDREIRLWEVGTGACRRVLTVDVKVWRDDSLSVRFAADDRQAVIAGPDATVRLWDPHAGGPLREVRTLYGARITETCLGDDGRLAAVTMKSQVVLWDLNSGEVVHHLSSSLLPERTASLSADGRLALSGDIEGHIRLWDTSTGEIIRTFDGPPQGGFHTVRMTADGRFAVSGGYWSYMTVWDVRAGRPVRILDGHEQGVGSLVLTPDGRFVLAGKDGHLRLWELDWDLAAQEPADWDSGAAPYLEAFQRRHGPRWTDTDFDALLRRLQDVGYGWLRADGVRARLDRPAR